jgi:hypothetical protein
MVIFLKEFTAFVGGVEYRIPKLRMGDYEAVTEAMRESEKKRILDHADRNGIPRSELSKYYVAVDSDPIPLGKIRWNALNTVEGARRVWERIWKRMVDKDAAAKIQAAWDELEPEELMAVADRAVTAEVEKQPDPPKGDAPPAA